MDKLQLVKSEQFGSVTCDVYRDENDFWMTREQIGRALEYADPRNAIAKVHWRNRERLDPFSGVVNLSTPSGMQDTVVYSARGVYEICRWSQQPKANAFYDWVYDLLENLRNGQAAVVPIGNLSPELQMFNQLFTVLASQELKQKQIEEQLQTAKHRIDTLDGINIQGDKRQQLNAMIRKYARQNGFTYSKAWKDFIQDFNTAYRMNLTARIQNHPKANLTTPGYLEVAGLLEDALRVADKMLQAKGA